MVPKKFNLLYLLESQRKAAQVEKHLPFALMQLAVELNIQVPFEKALENVAKGSYGLLSLELEKALSEIKNKGASFQEALLHLSKRIASTSLKQAVVQLINVYEQGYGRPGQNLKKVALELLARQKAAAKEFNAKIIMLSLLFVATAAIIPALFIGFVVLGSSFLEIGFTSWQIIFICCLAFPLANLAVLYLTKLLTPEFLRS